MVGDLVLARNETTGAYGFKPIAEVFRHRDPVKLHLTLEDPATGTTEVIETTPGHEFHSPDNGFVAAVTLKPGDLVSRADITEPRPGFSVVRLTADLRDAAGAVRVKALSLEYRPFEAYDLSVADHHTFFVGDIAADVGMSSAAPRGSRRTKSVAGRGPPSSTFEPPKNTKRFKQAQLSGSSMVVVGRASFISASRSPIVTIRPAISTP
ncbi:MAG: hypothetical protein HC834_02465 [Rhodospirillales bacterium]|nr:hypothetical protein [Rhodospirillales bacterium]